MEIASPTVGQFESRVFADFLEFRKRDVTSLRRDRAGQQGGYTRSRNPAQRIRTSHVRLHRVRKKDAHNEFSRKNKCRYPFRSRLRIRAAFGIVRESTTCFAKPPAAVPPDLHLFRIAAVLVI